MSSQRMKIRTTLAGAALALVAGGLWIAGSVLGGADSASGRPAEVYVLSLGDPVGVPGLPELQSAHRASSLSELQSTVAFPALVIVDRSVESSLPPASLRLFVSAGSAVIGLNIPLDRLVVLTGFDDEVASINPKFQPTSEAVLAPSPGQATFSLVWRSAPGMNTTYWGKLQNDLTPTLLSAVVADYRLRVRGLISVRGTVIPLEQYGTDPPGTTGQ